MRAVWGKVRHLNAGCLKQDGPHPNPLPRGEGTGKALLVSLLVLCCLLIVGCASKPTVTEKTVSPDVDWRNNPMHIVDRMIVLDDAADWSTGEFKRIKVNDDGQLTLDDPPSRERYPRSGTWTSPEYVTDFPFTQVLPSWNMNVQAESGVKFFIRSRDMKSGDWSPWLYIGSWGKTSPNDKQDIQFKHGKIDIDFLVLKRPADAYQMRAVFQSYDVDGASNPSMRKFVMIYSGAIEDESKRAELARPIKIEGNWARTLDVPFFTQADAPPALKPQICSPTSVTMVMQSLGDDGTMVDNALAIYDPEYSIFGNWGRAVAYAGQLGFDAYLDRIRTWDQVKAYIAQGQPLIASIRFESGTFPSNVMDSTKGHLVVIRGLTKDGDAVMNDSASKTRGEGIIYRSEELARAWIRHGGVAYIIRPMKVKTEKLGDSSK